MFNKEYRIENATSKDIKDIFELSNDNVVRKNSINQDKITWENHVKWFQARITSDEPFYVIRSMNNELIGQVRIDNNTEPVFSISISSDFRGKNLAAKIIKECSIKSKFKLIFAYIKQDNIISQKAFKKAGYTFVSEDNNLLKFKFNLP